MSECVESFTKPMGAREYMRFIGVKRDMAIRVMELLAATGTPSDTNMRWLARLSFNDLASLHDDLLRVGRVPYAASAFAMRISHMTLQSSAL